MKTTVNQRIKILREFLGLSMADFARLLEVHPSAITRIENGEIKPRDKTLINISNETFAEIEWLDTGKEPMYQKGEDIVAKEKITAQNGTNQSL